MSGLRVGSSFIAAVACLALVRGASAFDRPIEAQLTLKPKDIGTEIGYFIPERLLLSANKPAKITKEPVYANTPMYGTLRFGTAKDNAITVVLDEAPDALTGKLYVDANGDGDLTNDSPIVWERFRRVVPDGTGRSKELVTFRGSAALDPKVNVAIDGKFNEPTPRCVNFVRLSPETAKLERLPTDMIMYYRDYATFGKITLGSKTYKIALVDDRTEGIFDDIGHKTGGQPRVNLLIDRNGDGRFDPRYEVFDLNRPFNIDGVVYQLVGVTSDGTRLALIKSTQKVPEIPIPADLASGKTGLAFDRPSLNGPAIRFPKDFKGKLVLIDFWATWCNPCRVEIPGLVKVYDKYHSQGFEVVGVSMDPANQKAEIKGFMKDYGMTWAQVYDGKNASQEVAALYGVQYIPTAFLIDGTTGAIVASGDDLRGEHLDATVAKALSNLTRATAR